MEWLRHPNRGDSPAGGYATQTEGLRPQVATPPKQSGFTHRWLRHPNRVALPTGGYATQTEWLRPQVATPLKWSSPPKVEGELSTEKGYTVT